MNDQQQTYPILWSFRRCPYAMRARLAIQASRRQVWLREIVLSKKPSAFVDASPRGTVPVLVLSDGTLITESRDIMIWSLQGSDPQNWLHVWSKNQAYCDMFFDQLDSTFKQNLDQYKYASRFEPGVGEQSRQLGSKFLTEIDRKLSLHSGALYGENFGLLDAATLPFVRQFRGVDACWFDNQDWPALHVWLDNFLKSKNFEAVMQKYPPWTTGDIELLFPA